MDVSNLVYWFKNARAAYKRAEVRNNQNESNPNTVADCWTGSLHSMQGCLGEESSDDNRRLEDDDDVGGGSAGVGGGTEETGRDATPADEEEEEADDDRSSVASDQSVASRHFDHRHHPHHHAAIVSLKMEPADLNRSIGEIGGELEKEDSLIVRRQQQPQLTVDEDDYDDEESQQSDSAASEDDMEDYAENLSLSKTTTSTGSNVDQRPPASKKSADPCSTLSNQDYAGVAAAAAYPGFPLSLSHAQLNPHGLVYMASPYLQNILHHQTSGSGGGGSTHHLQQQHHHHNNHHHRGGDGLDPLSLPPGGSDDRRKRNRTFIDPVTEVPRLEHWFSLNTHPSHSLVLRYTEELNRQPYRLKFPKLEPKNVQFWFKNRRAKCKRLKLSL